MDRLINPQAENGHVDIANEILEALSCFRFSGAEWQIICVVLRKTYGWHKKADHISFTQFVLATKLPRRCVIRAIKQLVTKKTLLVTKVALGGVNLYSFNKHYNEWLPSDKSGTGSDNFGKRVVTKVAPTKETNTKEIKHMCISFDFEFIWSQYPNRIGKKQALKHFNTSVRTQDDYLNIQKALANYLNSKAVKSGYIQNGSTWFNNWQDWIDYSGVNPLKYEQIKSEVL